MIVLYHPAAREDLLGGTAYYESVGGEGLRAQFIAEYLDRLELVLESPNLWPVRDDGTRRVNLKRFPFFIAYLVREDTIWIIAVAHSARKPAFWMNRLAIDR